LLDAPPGAFVEAAWPALGMKDALVGFWDAFAASGRPPAGPPGGVASIPLATVGAPLLVPPGGSGSLRFVVAWRFPNRLEWPAASLDVSGTPAEPRRPAVVGNRYAGRCASAAEVAGRLAAGWDRLRARSLAFSASVLDSDLPPSVAEAALDTLVALRSETSFVTADGWFAGWEGTNDDTGSCHGSCTHVWNYEWATPLLFSELARSMRAGELERATGPDGHMSFRIGLTPESARRWQLAAADGQLGAVVKLYREWQLSGDRELLERLWPAARRALSYAWGASGWDRSGRGIADGCLHHTLDVEYIGPNPLVQFWYLAALRAGEELAGACGDEELAAACRGRFEQGSRFADDELFNGSFYAQRLDLAAEDLHVGPEVALDHWILDLRPPGEVDGPATAAATSRSAWLRAALRNGDEIPHQLGPGCLADQLAGEVAARLCGLGRLADPTKLRSAAAAVAEHNRVEQFRGVANPYRTYALNDDAGLVVAAYPHGGRPSRPAPYFSEVFSGFEYTAAAAMILHGLWEEGVRTVDDVRARYAGWNRNPFDEAECGHHYARSMASWAVVLAITGFWYSAPNGRVTVALRGARSSWPWSTGSAFGTVLLEREPGGVRVELAALEGSLAVREVVVCEPASGGEWALSSRAVQRVEPGAALVVSVTGPAAGEETAADGAAGEETAADGATASARRAPSST
ncbi:MAG TPA: GH116 family glycosyl hydrolase, partial [Acidimicrobiales bacterium]|nr:GH116 family glycosyl hydrolase [Acidimicrobiales bacterium]